MIHSRERFSYRPEAITYRPLLLARPALAVLDEPRRVSSPQEAYAYCEQLAQRRYENVPVASRFLPPDRRPHVFAIYAFARAANDFADEAYYASRRAEALEQWEHELNRAFHGEADHPIFVALQRTIDDRDLPITPFTDLMTAFRMDQATARYATFADLRRYCAFSAEPLGQLMLRIFGYTDPSLHSYAGEMCAGLQMANFLQDLGLDYNGHRGRLYLPLEDLRHFGVTEQELRTATLTPAYREMMRFQVARARAMLERGRPLIDRVGPDLSFELELTWHSGQAVLDKIEGVGYDVFRRRPILNKADRAMLLLRAAARRWPRALGRR